MESSTPQISVIIPAYNQAKFLSAAVDSVLAQTYRDYEIIVVDDGSTDSTAEVAKQYGDQVRYLYQDNLGLAGARNTGIRAARGEYIGLLDSDDIWLPEYLRTMKNLASQHPEAVVFFCAARCMDMEGIDLTQEVGRRSPSSKDLYHQLIRANFIIPSTVLMRQAPVRSAGLFDPRLRSCEDWDLWLRLLPQQSFVGIPDALVRYRIHGSSLSANVARMQQSVRAVIEKNFGPEDEDRTRWPNDKKEAFAGVYRFYLLSSIQRQNNWQCGEYLHKALQIDHSLAKDDDLFYDLSLGSQPAGSRDRVQAIDLEGNEQKIGGMLAGLLAAAVDDTDKELLLNAQGTAYKALSLVAYNAGYLGLSRKYTWRALRYRPELWRDRVLTGNLVKSLAGKTGLALLRRLRNPADRSRI
jgi:glycosyltransferase involved in cell wall biosynthesis